MTKLIERVVDGIEAEDIGDAIQAGLYLIALVCAVIGLIGACL